MSFVSKSASRAVAVTLGLFTFVPEKAFAKHTWVGQNMLEKCKWLSSLDLETVNIIISRIVLLLLVWVAIVLIYSAWLRLRRRIIINGHNYSINVEYGDILKAQDCKRVISFDECFTTRVGSGIADVNPQSICGQYLALHPCLNVNLLIETAGINPARSKSRYQQRTRYESGTIVPNGDDLLMAFAKLDEKGKGRFFSRDEYLECLSLLWREIENYYSENDVCVPILGAGTTSFDGGDGASFTQQELLDMMIRSYELSSHKIKAPHKLRIICKRNDDFSINRIKK